MEETFIALRDKPCKSTVQACAEVTVQAVKARDCQTCSQKVTEGMRDFVDLFVRNIEEAVSQVGRTACEYHGFTNPEGFLGRSNWS